MSEIRYTRNLFLRCVNVIYLFAFASFYIQIPGLYGRDGILPANTQLELKDGSDWATRIQKKPTLLWAASFLSIDTEYMMDILALNGMFIAFVGFIFQKSCNKVTFAGLWSLYYSLYQVGQTFMWFQWDILLLETGFLCILVAPLTQKSSQRGAKKGASSSPSDQIPFWLVKWLLFRLMFSSGVVKLISGCPQWWGLTALNIHFESQCIPTPLAWYAHHLPAWFLKLNTVFANFVEIGVPILFFFPLKPVRVIAFYLQVFLQLAIIATGNYNFFNFLTITLCLSLLDDDFFIPSPRKSSYFSMIVKTLLTISAYGSLLYVTAVLYGLKWTSGGVIESKIMFTKANFDKTLFKVLPLMCWLCGFSLIMNVIGAIGMSLTSAASSFSSKVYSVACAVVYSLIAFLVFSDSLVPLSNLSPAVNITTPEIREMHNKVAHLHLTNSYGLFRRMTGAGGRPEVIIEWSNSLNGPWTEYNFKYKPGNLNKSLPIVAPHQPRLDWQMWFAALGTYHQNPWIMSLTYRLLTGQKEVLRLLEGPFPNPPPQYVRANLYTYTYTPWPPSGATWTRKLVGSYFPVFSKDHAPLLDYLKSIKSLSPESSKLKQNPYIIKTLDTLREVVSVVEPPILMLSLFISGIAIIFAQSFIQGSKSQPVKVPRRQGGKK